MAPAPYAQWTTQEQAQAIQKQWENTLNASKNKDIIQWFLDASKDKPELSTRREAVKKMIQNGEDESFIADSIQNKMGISTNKTEIPQQNKVLWVGDTLAGIWEKTANAFAQWAEAAGKWFSGFAKGIGSNIYQMTHGGEKSTDVGRPLIEGLIGAGRAVTSPIEWVVSQWIEQVAAPIAQSVTPDVVKDLTKEWFANAQEWYNSQSEPTKQLIKDTGLTAEGALNLLWVKASPKVAEAALKWASKVTNAEIAAGKSIIEWARKVAPEIVKWAKAVGTVPSKIAEGGISLATGISKEAQTAIKKAPNAYEAARKWVLTRESQAEKVAGALKTRMDDLSDTGKGYQAVRKGVEVADKTELEDILAKNAWTVKSVNLPMKDRAAIKQVADYIAERGGKLTDDDLLSLRHNIDTTIGWQEWVSSKGQGIVRAIRSDIDKLAKERIDGLAKLDAKFSPEKKFLDEVRPLIFNKDGSLKDNYIQAIANITGKWKEMKLDRLEKIIPWIGDEMRALKAYEEVGNILSIKTGSVARQIVGTTAWGTFLGPIGIALWYAATNPALYARWLELVGKLGAKNAKKVIPRPLKPSTIIKKPLQSTRKPVKSQALKKKQLISK